MFRDVSGSLVVTRLFREDSNAFLGVPDWAFRDISRDYLTFKEGFRCVSGDFMWFQVGF